MTIRAGVDLGGTKVQTVIVDEQFSVLGQMRMPTPTKGGPQDVADTVAATIREACHLADTEPDQLTSIGVGSPGDVDDANGIVTSARNLPNWEGAFPLGGVLQEALGPPVSLGNDVNVATMAEFHLGAGQPYSSLLGVFWGTGVGGGVVLDGKLWLGRDAAGEIGHMVVKVGGAKCPCGRHGCMEAYAGRGAMETRARELVKKGEQTDLFEIMEKRGRDAAHQRDLGARAGAPGSDGRAARRPRDRGARRRRRVSREPARPRGGDHRRRAGRAARRSLPQADRARDAPARLRRHAPAAGAAGRSSATSAARSAPPCSPPRRRRRRPEPPPSTPRT